MNLEREWDKTYYLKNAGLEVDAVMQEDGTVSAESIDPTGETIGISDVFGGGVKPDIYSLSEAAGAPVTEKEVGGTQAGALAGVPGALATGVQDLGALLYGGLKALLAEEGQGVDEFTKGFSTISGAIGSEKAGELFGGVVDALPIDDETKEAMKRGYLAGEFASMGLAAPKLAKAGAGAVADYAAGAPARLEDAKSGVNLGMGVDPTQMVDEAIVGAQKAFTKPTKENPITAVAPTETEPGIIAFHGSGADFDEFRLDKIGTGEGAQAYGHGLYFTDSEGIAKFYRNSVSAIDRYAEPDFDTMAGGWTEELGFDLTGDQRTLSSADPDYDYYIQQLDDHAVDKVTDLTNNSKTWQFSDGSELTMETDDVATFNGKPLDSVYTRDIEDRFGFDIKRIADEAKKIGIRDDVDTLENDINTILANLSQGLHDMQDMRAAVDSLGRSTRYQTIYKKFIEPNIDFNKVDYVTLAGQPKGKMYKVGLTPKPDDLLDYDAPFSEQTKSVQENLVKAGYEVDPNTSASGSLILSAIMSKIAQKGEHLPGGKITDARRIASERLKDAGIPGIKYRAAGSRSSDVNDAAAKRNYVIFDDKAIKILEKYGIVGPVAVTALGATKQESAENGDL